MTTINIEQQELLDFIIEHPDDDVSRLVYADWLEEHHQAERAEFIRVQIELDKLFNEDTDWKLCTETSANWCPICGDCCCKNQDEKKNDENCPLHNPYSKHHLWDELKTQEKELRPIDYTHHATWRRGFVETISCPFKSWLQHGPTIVLEHPIQRVQITDKDPAAGYHGLGWCWFPDENWELINRPAIIPRELKDYMIGKPYHSYNEDDPDPFAFDYSSSESAHADLSQAVIKQAKIARKCLALIDQSHTDVVAANHWLGMGKK